MVIKKAALKKEGRVVLPLCFVTENAWERMCGLLPRTELGLGEALWISPCLSVHTFFMRFSIDAAFLDSRGEVLAIYEAMRPWRHSGVHFRAAGVLETAAGALGRAGVRKGEVLELCPIS